MALAAAHFAIFSYRQSPPLSYYRSLTSHPALSTLTDWEFLIKSAEGNVDGDCRLV